MVQRYRPDELEMIGMHPESDGDYVDYEDYAALEQRVKELAAEIAEPSIKELDVIYRIRKAIGDNGKMMQDELVSHIEGLVGRVKELTNQLRDATKMIDELTAENAELKKAHNFWRDQCASFEEQLFGKIQDNTLTRKRLKKL